MWKKAQLKRLIKLLADTAKYLEEEARGYRGAAATIEVGDKKHKAALERAEAADILVACLYRERVVLEAHGGP